MERRGGRAMYRWGATVIASTAALAIVVPTSSAQAATGPSGITAKGAYLLDSGANKQLWAKGADTKLQMASTTKIMTAVVVLDTKKVDLNKKVTVKKSYRDYVAREKASTADLKTGDKVTVRQLLYGLMLPSGCDAAYALADTFGSGSTEAARTKSFISKMNAKAKSLSLKNTKYDSFDGISAKGANYTTPREMAKLTRHAIKNGTFKAVVKSQSTKQKATNGRTYTWYNTNKLLGSYQGTFGVKTGTGTAAGPCLVFATTKGNRTVVGVLLNDSNRYVDAKKMLDWSFKTKTKVAWRALPKSAQQD
ncbi:D-alanyl-D-alanine carboxypeptidase family protein [Streptomyces zagrosensis]|uniref:D-alanyl-D-alanine carboxypeptidase (Penicillin-binding protein 5/6) n=1 Tax=Streptomyces zagrosensis TaxID=1042984 RepID=A0A7W9QDX5_9ACTN|nr:serine hydrolase [Streptomyces zagrosensis]MBB5938450.1 D-alanyl-D-alanine carboxypeptidase (penicillin-binding protein 5/6) [Streptomyces zagrosensis]